MFLIVWQRYYFYMYLREIRDEKFRQKRVAAQAGLATLAHAKVKVALQAQSHPIAVQK